MLTLELGLGVFLYVIGILVKVFPNLIAGYSTMPDEEKARFNIKGYSTLMMICFFIMGMIVIGSEAIGKMISPDAWIVRITSILLITIIMASSGSIYKS